MINCFLGLIAVGACVMWWKEVARREKAEQSDLERQQQTQWSLEQQQKEHNARVLAVLSIPSFRLMNQCLTSSIAEEVDENIRLVLMGALSPEAFNRKMDLIVKPFIDVKKKSNVVQPGETIEDLYNEM